MIIGYARVSTADQNLDLQRDALIRASCARIYEEHASGAREDRPELRRALEAMRRGDQLVVWKLDRLGRSVLQLIKFVTELREAGIEFRSITDGIDTSTPTGRFMFHVLASLAEMERDLIRERTLAGLAAARARGRLGGGKLKLTTDQVRTVLQLASDRGTTIESIARSFRVHRGTIYRLLERHREELSPVGRRVNPGRKAKGS
jgi:DNA invertase Pin-like site-specific DNA recombinase